MNCGNCGTPLISGSNVCPNCGALNILEPKMPVVDTNQGKLTPSVEQQENKLIDDFVTLEEENDVEQITEFMAPPSLEVKEENLVSGVTDIANASEVSTYSPEAIEKEKEQESKMETREKENVDIAIPSVQKPVQNVDMPADGTAPIVDEVSATVGEKTESVPLEAVDSKKKFKLKIKVNKNVPKNLMIIVAIIFLIIGILLGQAFFSKNYCVTTNTSNRVTEKTKFVADGKNNTTNVGNYTYQIPTDYIFDKSNGGLLVYDPNDSFRIFIRTDVGSYQDMSGGKNSIRETLRENSVAINGMKEISITEKNFLVFEGATKAINRLIAFTDAGNDYVFYFEIVTSDNTYDYDVLDIAADIALNATYENKSANMEKIDIYDISEVAIQAAEEYKKLVANN